MSSAFRSGEGRGVSSRFRCSGVGTAKGLSVISKEVSKEEGGCSIGRLAAGSGGVPRLVRLVEGAMMETPRGGLQNDTRCLSIC